MPEPRSNRFIFPQWINYLLPLLVIFVLGGGLYIPLLFDYGASAVTLNVGHQPIQPVPYSHALHAGQLGIDCRYCHTTVDHAAFAAVPNTQICMNCHNPGQGNGVRKESQELEPVRDSYKTGKPIQWVKVNKLPQFVYFNHSAHVNHGVSCFECHGRVDKMEHVYQAEPLSMSWCLDCHRNPASHLRPLDEVTNPQWKPERKPGETLAQAKLRVGTGLMQTYRIHDQAFMQSCSTCHR